MQDIQNNPIKTTPLYYRLAIYVTDATEENALKVLDFLRPTQFEGTKWSLKLDKVTEEGRFMSTGDKQIAAGVFKIAKYSIKRQRYDDDKNKYFEIIEGN